MATSNISNTILDLSGSAVSDVVVVARLKPGPGFRIYEGTEVASQVTTTSASNGAWSLTLEQNEPADPVDATKLGISPSGSYYEIEEQIPDAKGGLKSWTVTVGTTSQTLYAALVTTLPADVGPTYLTQSSGDARYSQLGNIGSTSTTAVAATASQGTASSAARSDHIHNLGSIVDSSTVELSSGLIRVKDSGITTAKINALAVTKDKLAYDGGNMIFADTAARLAAIPSPVAGMTAYINSGDSSEGLYSYTGATWNKGSSWNAPWGFVSQVTSTVSAQSTTGTLDLAGGSLSFTAFANRYYKISVFGSLYGDATVNSLYAYDTTAAASLYAVETPYVSATFSATWSGFTVTTFSAGTRNLKIQLVRFNAGTARSGGGVKMLVEDIGPSGAPN